MIRAARHALVDVVDVVDVGYLLLLLPARSGRAVATAVPVDQRRVEVTAPKMPRRARRSPAAAAWFAAPDAADVGQRPPNARDTRIPMQATPSAHHPLPPGHRTGSVLRRVLDGHLTRLRAWRSVPSPPPRLVTRGG